MTLQNNGTAYRQILYATEATFSFPHIELRKSLLIYGISLQKTSSNGN